jgi:preprotein translocase SecE subunit
MLKFFYDSLETLQKVKFATKKDYISLGLGVIFAIIVCGAFFIAVDTVFSGAYKTFYSIMKSDTLEDQMFDDTTVVS